MANNKPLATGRVPGATAERLFVANDKPLATGRVPGATAERLFEAKHRRHDQFVRRVFY